MAGQNLAILKLAALSLLETLQENDFVNIVAVVSNKKVSGANNLLTRLSVDKISQTEFLLSITFLNISQNILLKKYLQMTSSTI